MSTKILLFSTIWLVLQICSPAVFDSHAQSAMDYRKKGVIIVAPPYSPPFSFIGHNGEPKGFLIDYWEKWSHETGVPITFKLVPWKDTLSLIANGKADLHSGLFINDERRKFMAFSQPIYPVEGVLFTRADEPLDSDEIIKHYAVGILVKGYGEFFLRANYPKAKVKLYDNSELLNKALAENEVRAIVTDFPATMYYLSKSGNISDFKISTTLYTRQLHGGVLKGNEDLLKLVELGLSQIDQEEHEHLVRRWFVPDSRTDWKRFILPVAALAIIALGSVLYLLTRRTSAKG